jgi:hypothetical protein
MIFTMVNFTASQGFQLVLNCLIVLIKGMLCLGNKFLFLKKGQTCVWWCLNTGFRALHEESCAKFEIICNESNKM